MAYADPNLSIAVLLQVALFVVYFVDPLISPLRRFRIGDLHATAVTAIIGIIKNGYEHTIPLARAETRGSDTALCYCFFFFF